jgi:ABC-type transport system involved in cytochrome bd biosynthesis fused ATPase/permease subunit
MTTGVWSLAGPIKRQISVSVLVGLLVTAAYIAQGLLLALALAAVLRTKDVESAVIYVAGLAAVLVACGGLLWLTEVAAQKTAQATKEYMREHLLTKLIELGPTYANARQSGLRHAIWRARLAPVGRATPAHRHRARLSARRAGADHGRCGLQPRYRERARTPDAIREIRKSRTVLIIAHRPSTIRSADRCRCLPPHCGAAPGQSTLGPNTNTYAGSPS